MAKTAAKEQSVVTKVNVNLNEVDLYGVFLRGTDHRVYAGEGVPRERAIELATMLVAEAEIRVVRPAIA